MRVALDTHRYRDLCEGDSHVIGILQRADEVALSLPTLAELRTGFAHGRQTSRNEHVLTRFLNESRTRVLRPDEATTFFYARLYRQLRVQGTPIPTNDLWTAALVEQHQVLLRTRDHHFDHLPQLARI